MSGVQRRVLLTAMILLASSCERACSDSERRGPTRELGRADVGDVEVTLGAEVLGEHRGMRMVGAGGHDPIPEKISLPEGRWLPRPLITASRGGVAVEVENEHPNTTHWWRVSEPFDDEAEAQDALEALELDVCTGPRSLAYRMRAEGYDSGWHGVVLGRDDRVFHVRVLNDAERCEAALASLGGIDDVARAMLPSEWTGCPRFWEMGAEDVALECVTGFRHDVSLRRYIPAGLRDAIAEGDAHHPDLEAQLYACFRAEAAPVHPEAEALLELAPSRARREAFVADQLARCEAAGAGCAHPARVSREAARLEGDVCDDALRAGLAALGRDGRADLAMQVLDCAAHERVVDAAVHVLREAVGESAMVCVPGAPLQRSHRRVCRQTPLHTALGEWLARYCERPVLEVARGVIAEGPLSVDRARLSSSRQSAAARILGVCAPEELARALAASALTAEAREALTVELRRPAAEP